MIIFLEERYLQNRHYLSNWINDNSVRNVVQDIEGEIKKKSEEFWNNGN